MPLVDLVDVRVLVDGEELPEFIDPDNDHTIEAYDGDRNEHVRYVQAETGQHFAVRVTWKQGYATKDASHLYARVIIDGAATYKFVHPETKHLQKMGNVLTEAFSRSVNSYDAKDSDGEWKSAHFAFGVLGLYDGSDSGLTPEKLGKIGSIKICVYRAKKIQRSEPYIDSGLLPPVLDEVPEKIVKGRDLKTNVKYLFSAEKISEPQPRHHDYVPVEGDAGVMTTFLFKYRTKRALQNLGCIPRSPSPEPDYQLIATRQEEMLKEMKRQLNLSKLAYERDISRSREPSAGVASTIGCKREREEEDDDDDDDVTVVGVPAKKVAVEIDLTEDD